MSNVNEIQRLVDAELATIADSVRRDALKSILLPPRPLSLTWDYGKPGERYECWVIGLSSNGKGRLVYCENGFGPSSPWGFVGVTEDGMGMDCQWHVGLEHAAIGAGILDAPPDYEVP